MFAYKIVFTIGSFFLLVSQINQLHVDNSSSPIVFVHFIACFRTHYLLIFLPCPAKLLFTEAEPYRLKAINHIICMPASLWLSQNGLHNNYILLGKVYPTYLLYQIISSSMCVPGYDDVSL